MSQGTPTNNNTGPDVDHAFHEHLSTILAKMGQRFPERQDLATINSQLLPMVSMVPGGKNKLRSTWRDLTKEYRDSIMNRHLDRITVMFESSDHDMLKTIGIHQILVDPNVEHLTKESLWLYLQLLTVLAHEGHETSIELSEDDLKRLQFMKSPQQAAPPAQSMTPPPLAPPQVPPPVAPPQVPAAQPPAQKPNMEEMIKTALDAAPKIIETFNKVLKDDDGNNVVAQMIKQFTNPNALQPGLEANLMANVLESQQGGSSVMSTTQDDLLRVVQQQVGNLSANEVVERLKKLERLEKLREKRRNGSK